MSPLAFDLDRLLSQLDSDTAALLERVRWRDWCLCWPYAGPPPAAGARMRPAAIAAGYFEATAGRFANDALGRSRRHATGSPRIVMSYPANRRLQYKVEVDWTLLPQHTNTLAGVAADVEVLRFRRETKSHRGISRLAAPPHFGCLLCEPGVFGGDFRSAVARNALHQSTHCY